MLIVFQTFYHVDFIRSWIRPAMIFRGRYCQQYSYTVLYAHTRRFFRDSTLKIAIQGLAGPHYCQPGLRRSVRNTSALGHLDPAQPFQQNNPAHVPSMFAAICFTFAQHLLHQRISPAIPQEQPIFNLKHERQANCTFGYASLFLATPKPQSGANKESEAMAEKDRVYSGPMDVLVRAESKDWEGIEGNFASSGHKFYHRGQWLTGGVSSSM